MRRLLFVAAFSVAACAGNVADYVGPRASILQPQLVRYGLGDEVAQCVGARLAAELTPLQLRRLERAAAAIREGYYEPDRLGIRDLLHIASNMPEEEVAVATVGAASACNAMPTSAAAAADDAAGAAATGAAADVDAVGAVPQPIWLNLGAAGSGQAIALDGSSVRQEGNARIGWFRMTNPGISPSLDSYRLRIDCAARTIQPLAFRRVDGSGAIVEFRAYSGAEEPPLPIEGGTVTEIAYLSLCTP